MTMYTFGMFAGAIIISCIVVAATDKTIEVRVLSTLLSLFAVFGLYGAARLLS